METYKNKERAENITIYLVNTLSVLEKGKIPIEDIDLHEEEPLEKKYIDIFHKLSNVVAKILDEKLIDVETEVIINSTIPKKGISTKEAYSNFKIIDNEVDGRLSKAFKGRYAFLMAFNIDEYYGMPCYAMDAFIAVHGEEMYGPIYICASNSPDLKKYKEQDEEEARQLIKRIIKD